VLITLVAKSSIFDFLKSHWKELYDIIRQWLESLGYYYDGDLVINGRHIFLGKFRV